MKGANLVPLVLEKMIQGCGKVGAGRDFFNDFNELKLEPLDNKVILEISKAGRSVLPISAPNGNP
jgi:hypothetical protein